MATTKQEQYERLRKLFNSAIRGPNTDAVLWALANPAVNLINNIEAIHTNVYIATAVDRYLDQRLADYNLIRPPEVGLSDDIFRQIGISVINKKQVRELLMSILTVMFGEELTQATAKSGQAEPYNLDNGDTLRIRFDGGEVVEVKFETSQFVNINTATAQEIADIITQSLRSQGKTGRAIVKNNNDGLGSYVVLISDTEGPQSSVVVLGGRAQNVLLFDKIRPTTGDASTQWTVAPQPGGLLRFTWTGGADPSIGKIRAGDYVNIFASGFDSKNQGTFNVANVKGGIVNTAYFEVENLEGVLELAPVSQGTSDGILFFQPFKNNLITKSTYAAIFQEEKNLLEVFIPATTKVIRRERKGAAHLHEPFITTETYVPGQNQIVDFSFPAPASINDGDYFLLNSANNTNLYYVFLSKIAGSSETLSASNSIFNLTGTLAYAATNPESTGQSFKALVGGNLSRIRLLLTRSGIIAGNVRLLIYANPNLVTGFPGTLLGASNYVDVLSIGTTATDVDFTFSSTISLNTTDTYSFIIDPMSITNLGGPSSPDRLRGAINTSNVYSDGTLFQALPWPSFSIFPFGFDFKFDVFTAVSPLDPNIAGRTGIQVDISTASTATNVAAAVSNKLNTYPYFGSALPNSNLLRLCWLQTGVTAIPTNGNISGLTINQIQAGTNTVDTTTSIPNPDEALPDQEGPYAYDLSQPFVLSDVGSLSTAVISSDSGRIISVSDSSEFPDEQGFLILGYGTEKQEGPVPYLARPSNNTLLISPSYQIINTHAIGTDVRLVSQLGSISIDKIGADYPAYVTDVISGRIYAENLINEIAATGINLVITILYPGSEGLGKWGEDPDEKVVIWGGDDDV